MSSVHRARPYNINTAQEWLAWFYRLLDYIVLVINFRYTASEQYEKIPENDPGLLRALDEVEDIISTSAHGPLPRHGEISHFAQATKFVVNLTKWGVIYLVNQTAQRVPVPALQTSLWTRFIQPMSATVRTISYVNLEIALKSYASGEDVGVTTATELTEMVQLALSQLEEGVTPDRLVSAFPRDEYRTHIGAFDGINLRMRSSLFEGIAVPTALAYSLSLPLLLTTGKSGYSRILDMRMLGNNAMVAETESRLNANSLPKALGANDVPLYIVTHMSEAETLASLNAINRTEPGEYMLAVEIPPETGLFSLGLIYQMTLNRESHATVAISSDAKGLSVYVISYGRIDLDVGPANLWAVEYGGGDLGELSSRAFTDRITAGNYALLPSVTITPLLQAGIPATIDIVVGGSIVEVEVDEEFLDRSKVSFIECPRTTHDAVAFAQLDLHKSAQLIRVFRLRASHNHPVAVILTATSHLLFAYFPLQTAQGFLRILTEVWTGLATDDLRGTFLYLLVDLMNNLPLISVDSAPLRSQMEEASLDMLDEPQLTVRKGLRRKAAAFLGNTRPDPELQVSGNPIMAVMEKMEYKVTAHDILEAIREQDESDSEEELLGGAMTRAPAPAPMRAGPPLRRLLTRPPRSADIDPDPGWGRLPNVPPYAEAILNLSASMSVDPTGPDEGSSSAMPYQKQVEELMARQGYPESDIELITTQAADKLEAIATSQGLESLRMVNQLLDDIFFKQGESGGVI